MISIRDLNASYGPNLVLHNINLEITDGQVLGLIGPNGSGKTSLIRAISGVLNSISGTITLDGRDLFAFSHFERARRIAVVPQSAIMPPAFTVRECVSLGRTPHLSWLGRLGSQDEIRVESALKAAEIWGFEDRRVGELSGGEQQRVLLARALAQDCPILIMDEPTAHLDLHHQVALLQLLRRMAHEKKLAVMVALHDLNLASQYADRLALLVDGRIHSTGTPQEVLTADALRTAYKVHLQVLPVSNNGRPWVVPQDH